MIPMYRKHWKLYVHVAVLEVSSVVGDLVSDLTTAEYVFTE